MNSLCWRVRLFVGLVMICCSIYHTVSGHTICTDYLVSGLYGVEDVALTASSSYVSGRHKPPNARLHFTSDLHYTGRLASWSSSQIDVHQYIQVQFPRETVVDAVLIQGLKDYDQWITTFYLLYSMDGITWTTVVSQNQDPQLFTGSSDRNTVVKSSVDPSITAMYLRVNPRSWHGAISLRFDFSGCFKVKKARRRSSFKKLPTPTTEHLNPYLLFESHSISFPACSGMCHKEGTCFSFTFDENTQICRGFITIVTGNITTFIAEPTEYFTLKGTSVGFRPISNEINLYKVNERAMSQSNATNLCIQHQARLMRVDSESKLSFLQNVVSGNTILMQDHSHLFVSGRYVPDQWEYSDGDELINSALWSQGHPDASQGHCVMLTQTGLASVDCTNQLFSICEKV